MQGVLVTNGYYFSPSSRHQVERLVQEAKNASVTLDVYENNGLYSGRELPETIKKASFALFFDKDAKLANAIESAKIKMLNPARSIEIADDKALTSVYLDRFGLPTPLTIPSPKRYDNGSDPAYLKKVGEKLGYPLVVKEDGGSLGQQVYLVKDEKELLSLDARLGNKDRLYQQYVEGSRGKSYRVLVVGGKVLCAMELSNGEDFRSNAAVGGIAKAVTLQKEYVDLAEQAAQKLSLGYCGVDLFCDRPSVIELNSNAYFLTAEKATGKNVARAIIEQAMSLVKGD